eukprot:GDKJ01018046.1.p1 GENE.GDKJ01018046.1~~GDKJ01018046.1.p1  ORF type:complete len:192 (-),score=3.54 GDKJ01018046.1:114-689(-)
MISATTTYILLLGCVRMHYQNVMAQERRNKSITVLKTSEPWQRFMMFHVACWTFALCMPKCLALSKYLTIPDYIHPLGWIFGFSACVILYFAHEHLREQYTPNVTVLSNQRLVISGPYSVIRHPMYLALIMYAFALCCNYELNPGFVINLFGTIGILKQRIALEEKIMEDSFAEKHSKYCSNTPKLIPFLC